MHQCLRISEVVREIVRFLSQSPETFDASDNFDPDHCGTLLAFSLSSKMFLELGLDALWSCLNSVHPLFDILTPRNPNEQVIVTFAEQMNFLWQLNESLDWTRFNIYARRVNGLTVNSGEMDEHLCRVLNLTSHKPPLLPNLRRLNWRDSNPESLQCLNSFAGPKLTSIELDLGNWSRELDRPLASTFSSFSRGCPNLHRLTISIEQPLDDDEGTAIQNLDNSLPPSDVRQMCMILSVLLSLQHVTIGSRLFDVTLLTLSRMPNLHTLIIDADWMYDDDSDWIPPPQVPYAWFTALNFPVLRHLSWGSQACFPDLTRKLFRVVDDLYSLQSIHITGISCQYSPITIVFDPVFRATCSPQNLTSFTMGVDYHQRRHLAGPMLKPTPALKYFQPLLDFKKLEVFEITWCCRVTWEDEFLRELSIAWPNLRTLVLRGTKDNRSPSRITLPGLKSIATNCPRLTLVEVDVQWTGYPSLEQRDWDQERDSQISRAVMKIGLRGMGQSGEKRQLAARRFLGDIFPRASITLAAIGTEVE